jgi:predicted transcriptional regulator
MNQGSINGAGEVVLYKAPDGEVRLDVRLERETVWLTQSQIAKLFGVKVPAVSKHIKNVYATRELQPKSTVSKMEIVRTEGKRQVSRPVDLYSLDMIISVGYRANSARATQFRIWATRTLKDHLLRGYTLIRHLPTEAIDDAFRKVSRLEGATLDTRNRVFHQLPVDGVTVEYRADGSIRGAQARLLDFDDLDNNEWLAVNQFTEFD